QGSADVASPPGTHKDKAYTTSNTVSYYPFQSSGATDQWGSNDGTVNGATYKSSGGPRGTGAYSFDGTDDAIDLPSFNQFSEYTISFWMKPGAYSSGWKRVVTIKKNNGILFQQMDTSNKYRYVHRNSSGETIVIKDSPAEKEWHHYTLKWDGSKISLIKNGSNLINEKNTSSISGTSDGNALGYRPFDSTEYWNGKLTDVRIYNRALKPHEIQQLYQYGTRGVDMRRHLANKRK
ncbi:MAG: LamG domain-containing protein, partial [Candidatus Aenigmatarchaeota archaeon]